MPKKRRVLGGALLTAAATALTVKAALSGPLGAVLPVDELQHAIGLRSRTPAPASSGQVPAGEHLAPQEVETKALRAADPLDSQRILREAAIRHQLDPKLVLAVSYWESGWDQSRVSQTGAIGLMQVQPATAQEAGPALLGRKVDITDAYDNADVGSAILKQDLDLFHDPAMALAAYYQGPTSLRASGMFADTQQYVDGILQLAARMNA